MSGFAKQKSATAIHREFNFNAETTF